MSTKNIDDFLLRLVEDISSIKTTVSNLESQMSKYDDKLVAPVQDLIHEVKTNKSDIERIEQKLTEINSEDKVQSLDIAEIKKRIDMVKYSAVAIASFVTILAGIAYKIIGIISKAYF